MSDELTTNWVATQDEKNEAAPVVEKEVQAPVVSPVAAAPGKPQQKAVKQAAPEPKKPSPSKSTIEEMNNSLGKGEGYIVNGKLVNADGKSFVAK